MTTMRILFLSSVFPRPYAPTRGVYSHSLLDALARDHEVTVISPRAWPERLRQGSLAGARTDHAGLRTSYPTWYYPPRMLHTLSGWFMWASIRSHVRRVVEDFRPDCVLSYWAHPDGEAGVCAARFAGVPSVVIVGGSDVLLLPRDPARRKRIAAVLRSADAVAAVSQDLRKHVIELGVSPGRVHLYHQGIDGETFSPGDWRAARLRLGIPVEGKVVLWVGRMVPVKGLDVLLEAWSQLNKAGTAPGLYLVGDGPLRSDLEAEVRRRGLAGVITCLGTLPPKALPDWYRAADLTVLPSRSEGLPNVLRESLACGTSFLASNVGGIAEIPAGEAGHLVAPEDPSALASAVAALPTKAESSITPPPVSASWAASAQEMLAILNRVVHDRCCQSMVTSLGSIDPFPCAVVRS
jgi:glycosyltransferase involved in cell wall biosynthesis